MTIFDNPTSRVSHRGVVALNEERQPARYYAGWETKVGRRCYQHPGPWHFLNERKHKMNATTTTARQQRKPRPKPERRISLITMADGSNGVRIKVGKTVNDYRLTPLFADFGGAAFHLDKEGNGGESYDVMLDGKLSHCECAGFLRWTRCKHVEGLIALQNAGRI